MVGTPSHTPGQIALFDPRDGSLIAGDAFQTRAGVAVSGTIRLLFPFPALATWSRPLAYHGYVLEHLGVYTTSVSNAAQPPDGVDGAFLIQTIRFEHGQEHLDDRPAHLLHFGVVGGGRAHGFTTLELTGGFGLALDRDESFLRLLRTYVAGLGAKGD